MQPGCARGSRQGGWGCPALRGPRRWRGRGPRHGGGRGQRRRDVWKKTARVQAGSTSPHRGAGTRPEGSGRRLPSREQLDSPCSCLRGDRHVVGGCRRMPPPIDVDRLGGEEWVMAEVGAWRPARDGDDDCWGSELWQHRCHPGCLQCVVDCVGVTRQNQTGTSHDRSASAAAARHSDFINPEAIRADRLHPCRGGDGGSAGLHRRAGRPRPHRGAGRAGRHRPRPGRCSTTPGGTAGRGPASSRWSSSPTTWWRHRTPRRSRVRDQYVNPQQPPASTAVEVRRLVWMICSSRSRRSP